MDVEVKEGLDIKVVQFPKGGRSCSNVLLFGERTDEEPHLCKRILYGFPLLKRPCRYHETAHIPSAKQYQREQYLIISVLLEVAQELLSPLLLTHLREIFHFLVLHFEIIS